MNYVHCRHLTPPSSNNMLDSLYNLPLWLFWSHCVVFQQVRDRAEAGLTIMLFRNGLRHCLPRLPLFPIFEQLVMNIKMGGSPLQTSSPVPSAS